MKINPLKIAMSLLIMGFLFSANSVKAQIGQGSILVEPYYGFPATGLGILKAFNQSGDELSTSSLGPVGLRFNYMFTEKVGIGLDGNYSDMSFSYNDGTYDYTVGRSVVRVMLNTHFLMVNDEAFQFYGNAGVGYRSPTWTFTSTDPNYQEESGSGLIPVAFKLAVGARYMFTPNIGAHAEFNLGGGSWTTGGLSFAF